MRIHSPDAYNEKPRMNTKIYTYGIFGGILLAVIMVLIGKGVRYFFGMVIKYWIFALVLIAVLIFLKKFFGKKHMVVHQAKEATPEY